MCIYLKTAMAPTRKRARRDVEQLQECLAEEAGTSIAAVRRIWNRAASVEGGAEALSEWELRQMDMARLAGAKATLVRVDMQPAARGAAPLPLYVAQPSALLRHAVQRCPAWAAAVDAAMNAAQGAPLQMVIYHDDVTTGNILAPRKDKKCTLIYLGLRDMCTQMAHEDAWLPVAFLLREHVAGVAGGLAAVLRHVSNTLHAEESLLGFPLPLPSGARWCVLGPRTLFLGDMDAQRATWSFKGSAGLKPCMHCLNVLSKDSGLSGHPFVEIDEPSLQNCVAFKDADVFSFAEELAATERAGARAEKEKLCGINHCPEGLLLDRAGRQHLPPSAALTDAFHCYFSNGCASWELGFMVECLRKEGAPLAALQEAIEWRRPGSGKSPWRGAKLWLHPKMWDKEGYKGDGHQAWALVPLLFLLASEHLGDRAHCRDKLRSFGCLARICHELRCLLYLYRPIVPADVDRLVELQSEHQKAFVVAWGRAAIKPKHHHRLHVPAAAVALGRLPSTEQHEKKHRCVKGTGVLDRRKRVLHADPASLQLAVLPRLIESTLRCVGGGLGEWGPVMDGAVYVEEELQHALKDGTLQAVPALQLGLASLRADDLLLWQGRAGLVTRCLSGERAGMRAQVSLLELRERREWGVIWARTGRSAIFPVETCGGTSIPPWWRLLTAESVASLR